MKHITLTLAEMEDMQQRIDKGIRLAQQRLVQRAIHNNFSLVVFRDGHVIDLHPNETNVKF